MVTINQIKPILTLNKPIYVGFSVLELKKKLLMYKLHYEYTKNKFYGKLLFTHTDSLVYEIETNNVYEDSYQDKDLFHFSDCPVNSKFFDEPNKKLLVK